jgi:general secretion pathway protein K
VRPERERGAALLTVLMLVAVIAVMAGSALEKLRLSTRLAGNAASIEAARGYARAAETLAVGRINNLLGGDPTRVTLAGGWSDQPIALPLPGGGTAVVRVADGGNCFNLNSLVSRVGPGVYISNPAARVQFARLMRLVGIPGQTAEGIAASAADWIDSDQDQQASGAEDGVYLSLAPGYRTAGTLMVDVSELRAVQGVSPDVFARLRPWLCALPLVRPVRINVNTLLPEQAPLLAMLLPDTLGTDAARQVLLRRPPQGFDSAAKFWAQPGLAQSGEGLAQTDVTTTWFKLDVGVTVGGTGLEQHGLIDATRLPAQVATRQWGEAS